MRWIKHLTDSHDDEKLAKLISAHGMEGYGLWWLLIELIGKQIGKDEDRVGVSYPMSRWMSIADFYHHSKFKKIIGTMVNLSLISIESPSNLGNISELSMKDVITISIPNILKYRDEYSKKSRHYPDKKPNVSLPDTEADTEVKTTTVEDDKSPPPPAVPKLSFDFSSGEFININGQVKRWAETFPAVNVDIEVKKAASWLMANPNNKKSNYERFLHNWLTKAQDKAPRAGTQQDLFPRRGAVPPRR